MIKLNKKSRQAWKIFLGNQLNHGHAERELIGGDVNLHVNACFISSQASVERIKRELDSNFHPSKVLEIGSSAGLNCFALQEAFPNSVIFGIEPEKEAVLAAESMIPLCKGHLQPIFFRGYGESLPFEDDSFDLIVCHTVIEHVLDVSMVVAEMSRVLRSGGIIHLEAPNYNYPFEPHLSIFTIPKFGKKFVRATAILQGKEAQLDFLDHLKFITPGYLQKIFSENNLIWRNLAIDKLRNAAHGNADVKKYHFASKVLKTLSKVGLANPLIFLLSWLGLYPSLIYTLRKKR